MVQSEPRHNLPAYLQYAKSKIFAEFETQGSFFGLQAQLKHLIDDCVLQIWSMTVKMSNGALIAIGGYGRVELFPYSDISLLILVPDQDNSLAQSHINNFIQLCADSGLKINLVTQKIDDCLESATKDIFFQTSLLDIRFLGGDRDFFDKFNQRFQSTINPQNFFYARQREMRQRYLRYRETPYALEPNCKDSPGGLRDLETVLWISRTAGLGASWQELLDKSILKQHELRELLRNQKLLQTIRIHLHLLAGQKQDALTFDLQPLLAERLGFAHGDQRQTSEQLMHEYYLAVKLVTQVNTILMLELEALLFPASFQMMRALNEDFYERQGTIEIADSDLFQVHPEKILDTFLIYAQTPGLKGLSSKTLRALYLARNKMDANWRNDFNNRACFMKILQSSADSVVGALKLMNQTGVLGRYLLSFRQVMGQMPHDSFHVYTVDQHILTVIQNLNRFGVPEHVHEQPFCSQLFTNFDRPWVLIIAALFHDVVKGHYGDHLSFSSNEAKQFCEQHKLNEEDSELIVWLVKHHLMMNHLTKKLDTSDPNVILQFAKMIKNERYLTALYLLTIADVRGSGPKIWNAWDDKLLETLYRNTLQALGGASTSANANTLLIQRQQEALAKLQLYGLDSESHLALWEHLDVGFFLRYNAEQIAWLTRHLWDRVNDDYPVVKAHLSPVGEGVEVVVYTRDRPNLFGLLCGYFVEQQLTVLEAGVYTTHHGYALDVFYLAASDPVPAQSTDYRNMLSLIETSLAELLTQPLVLPQTKKEEFSEYERNVLIKPHVELRPDQQEKYFLLSLSANDRVGLLYKVAQVLAKHNIQLRTARITTLGERVEDIFLLEGEALIQNSTLQAEIEADLLKLLTVS